MSLKGEIVTWTNKHGETYYIVSAPARTAFLPEEQFSREEAVEVLSLLQRQETYWQHSSLLSTN